MTSYAGLGLVLLVAAAVADPPAVVEPASAFRASQTDILASSHDRAALERAAVALARQADEASLYRLQQLLTDPAFLARLDDVAKFEQTHITAVIAALGERPSPAVVALCQLLAEDPVFVSMSDRKGLVLDVLASVTPMSDRTAAIFRRSNPEGYFSSNALLLVANRSDAALRLFESMMVDPAEPAGVRVESLRRGLVPRRHQAPVLRMAARILATARERAIAHGVVESIFDYKQEWFGIESRMVKPPGWSEAPNDARQAAAALADRALQRRDLAPALRARVIEDRKVLAPGAAKPPKSRLSRETRT